MKVFLANRGNIDFAQDPDIPVYGTPSDYFRTVENINVAIFVVRNYIGKHNLGSGNWVGGQVFENDEIIGSISYNGKFWPKDHKYFKSLPEIHEESFLRAQIEQVADMYAEHRSDVSDVLYGILDGKGVQEYWREHRFVKAAIPEGATEVVYDTLTTFFDFNVDDDWVTPTEVEYTDA